jgi:hypothetical protein
MNNSSNMSEKPFSIKLSRQNVDVLLYALLSAAQDLRLRAPVLKQAVDSDAMYLEEYANRLSAQVGSAAPGSESIAVVLRFSDWCKVHEAVVNKRESLLGEANNDEQTSTREQARELAERMRELKKVVSGVLLDIDSWGDQG